MRMFWMKRDRSRRLMSTISTPRRAPPARCAAATVTPGWWSEWKT
jgi:hypothetical protein